MRKRLVVLMALALIVASVFMFIGLPTSNLGWTSVSAQYTAACASTYQARYPGVANLYADKALTQFSVQLASGVATKLLICDDTFTEQPGPLVYLKVQFSGEIYYTSAAGVGIVPREFSDDQP
ncbi:MAG: hypothetical protein KF716_06000 [Anaerolineae bacterium]|nr:hypothetical protein [Anaerolineae bacterium]